MKDIKCPLCSKALDLVYSLFRKDHLGYGFYEDRFVYYYACHDCKLAAEYGATEEEAAEKAEQLINKFPPFMRVWPGDKVKLYKDRHPKKIIGKYAARGILYLETASGPTEPVRYDDVILWPWDLEQEGGDNGQ